MLVWPFDLAVATRTSAWLTCRDRDLPGGAAGRLSDRAAACRRRLRCVLVGWFWFLGMIVPVSGIVMVGEESIHDRYTYLSYMGLLLRWFGEWRRCWREQGARSSEQGAGRRGEGRRERSDMPSPPAPLPEGEGSGGERDRLLGGARGVRIAWAAAALVLAFFAVRAFSRRARGGTAMRAVFSVAVAPDELGLHATYGICLEASRRYGRGGAGISHGAGHRARDFQRPVELPGAYGTWG